MYSYLSSRICIFFLYLSHFLYFFLLTPLKSSISHPSPHSTSPLQMWCCTVPFSQILSSIDFFSLSVYHRIFQVSRNLDLKNNCFQVIGKFLPNKFVKFLTHSYHLLDYDFRWVEGWTQWNSLKSDYEMMEFFIWKLDFIFCHEFSTELRNWKHQFRHSTMHRSNCM